MMVPRASADTVPGRPKRWLASLIALAAAAAMAGCGSLGPGRDDLPNQDARLLISAAPSGVHAGIHLANARDYARGEGVRLRVRGGSDASAVRLLREERVEAAVMDIHELGRAREDGADLVGVMALVQRPLVAVIARPPVDSPADLEGRRTAVPDASGRLAALRSMVRHDGGHFARVQTVTTERGGDALTEGRVAATLGRWDVDGVAIAAGTTAVRELRVERYGAPRYPQLVLVVNRYVLEERTGTVRALIRTLQRGYREAGVDPESAVAVMRGLEGAPGREQLLAQVAAVSPAWTAGAGDYGELDTPALREWSAWAARHGALRNRLDVERAFAFGLTRPQEDG